MTWHIIALLGLIGATAAEPGEVRTGRITGTAVNGSHGMSPLENAEVILRAMQDGVLLPFAETRTDAEGRFAFDQLPFDDPPLFLPGVNIDGVHYPGKRLRLDEATPQVDTSVIAYESEADINPLVAKRHELIIRTLDDAIECREILQLENPTRKTFVGRKIGERMAVTLRLSLPAGFETVTFDKEFFGRQFQVLDGRLITDLPWMPGAHEVAFTYRLPIESQSQVIRRSLDVPTRRSVVRSDAHTDSQVQCNLPSVAGQNFGELQFEYQGDPLPAGYTLEIRLGKLSAPFMSYGRWGAVAMLAAFIAGAAWWTRRSRGSQRAGPIQRIDQPHSPPRPHMLRQQRGRRGKPQRPDEDESTRRAA